MSRTAREIIRCSVAACILAGSVAMFQQTISFPVEIARNFELIWRGLYSIPSISDASFYAFNGYAVIAAIAINLVPARGDIAEK